MEQLNILRNIELLVDITNITKTLASIELIICASGGTLFEIWALRKKFINIQVASNQQKVVDFLDNHDINTTYRGTKINSNTFKNNVYKKLSLEFSKNKLAKKILALIKTW